ncbi:MAG: hypothetical protein ACOYXM_13365 [Actinomycetota bacterium]
MVEETGDTSHEDLTLEPARPVTKRAPRSLWAVLAVIAVATGALVVTSGGEGGPPRLPVALGASSAGREAAGAMSADMALAWVTYLAGDDLPALGGEAPAYKIVGAVDEGRVRALAAALGLDGDPTHDGSLWRVESADGILEVYEEGGGSWWFSASQGSVSGGGSAGCEPGPAVDCAVAEPRVDEPATTVPPECAADGSDCVTTFECPPDADCAAPEPVLPTPAADLPSEDEARQIALDLLAEATGIDLGDAKVTVDGPYDAWYIMVEPRLDGTPVSGWQASVGVGPHGEILNAAGTLGTAERVGDYPLIDTRAAVDRLNEMQGGYYGDPVPLGAPDGVTRDAGVAVAEDPAGSDPGAAPTTTVVPQCKVQPDGSEVCELSETGVAIECPDQVPVPEPAVEPGDDPVQSIYPGVDCAQTGICYDTVPPADAEGAPETTLASPICTEPIPYPYPEPEPVEITLHEAEPVLIAMPAFDRGSEMYLVPGYRLSGDDGAVVEVIAVADDSLAPTTTVPETTETTEGPTPPPTSCETAVEDDGSGTTHTVQTCPEPSGDPVVLEEGQEPEIGVGYYVDVNVITGHCNWVSVQVADRWWWAEKSEAELAEWSTPTEGGTFTLIDENHAQFVGDSAGRKTADLTIFGDGTQPPGCA